jgi:hypothetical protein
MTPRAKRIIVITSIFIVEALLVYFLVARRFSIFRRRLFVSLSGQTLRFRPYLRGRSVTIRTFRSTTVFRLTACATIAATGSPNIRQVGQLCSFAAPNCGSHGWLTRFSALYCSFSL